jgi:uncharacterized protein (TIRG00374 family)
MMQPPAATKPQTKSILRRMIPGFLLGFLVLVGLALLGDLREMRRLLTGFDWRIFPLALGFTLFNYSLRFLKWQYYLGQIGARIPWRESLRLFVAGFPLAMTPGKVGEVLKGVWINQRSGVPSARGVSVVAAERISDGLGVLALSTLGVIANPRYWPAFAFVLALLLGLVVISQIRPLALGILALGERIPLIKKTIPALREFYEGSFALFKPGVTLLAVGLGTISWLGEGIGFSFILRGLGLPPTAETAANAIFILAFSTIVGAVTALPGGLGAAEVSIAGMLVLVAGAETAVASAATLLIRLATLWFGLLLGLAVWPFSLDLLGLQPVPAASTAPGQND